MAAPYAIKKQRAQRDAERATALPKTGKLKLIRAESLARIPWLVHGFSTRQGGVTEEYGGSQLNLGFTKEDKRENVERNRELFMSAVGAANRGKLWPLVNLSQVHSPVVFRVSGKDGVPHSGDGLITNTPGVLIAVKIADCTPVLAVDLKRKVVGAFHAGWRGTVQRIVEKGVGRMRKEFGSDPAKLIAAIGPGVRACCYAVGREVRDQFESQFAYAAELFSEVYVSDPVRERYPLLFLTARAPGHSHEQIGPQLHLDLGMANRRQLEDAGVRAANITDLGLCTACKPRLLFSYRKMSGRTGRLLGAIGMRRR